MTQRTYFIAIPVFLIFAAFLSFAFFQLRKQNTGLQDSVVELKQWVETLMREKAVLEQIRADFESERARLENRIVLYEKRFGVLENAEKTPCDRNEGGRCVVNSFKIITPNGGEQLCYGRETDIMWEAPKDMDSVKLFVQFGSDTSDVIGSYPATYNESDIPGQGSIRWHIPDTLEEGYLMYKMIINSTYKGYLVSDISDRPFSVQNCEG